MIGLIDRERVDTQLYDDYETEKAREVHEFYVYFSHLFIIPVCLVKFLCFEAAFVLCSRSFTFLQSSGLFVSICTLTILIIGVATCYVEKVSKRSSCQ